MTDYTLIVSVRIQQDLRTSYVYKLTVLRKLIENPRTIFISLVTDHSFTDINGRFHRLRHPYNQTQFSQIDSKRHS